MGISEDVRARIRELGGTVTREQCQQVAREFGRRNINWLFGTRHPSMMRLANGLRTLV